MHRALLALTILAATGTPAAAQQRMLVPGDEVRVVAPAFHRGPVRGELVRYMGDTLAVRETSTDSVYVIPLEAVRRLALNEGPQRGRSVRRGGALGVFIGGALGILAGPFIASSHTEDDTSILATTALSGLAGLAVGGGVGAASGALFGGDHWQHYTMARREPCRGQACPAPAPVAEASQR